MFLKDNVRKYVTKKLLVKNKTKKYQDLRIQKFRESFFHTFCIDDVFYYYSNST